LTKQYAVDMAKKLFRETNKSYYVIHDPDSNEYSVLAEEEFSRNASELNRWVIFTIGE